MRTYTFTLSDETEYEISIDAENEEKAEEILDSMMTMPGEGPWMVAPG